jgi:sugar lactone lactonase YvrE
MTVSSLRHHAVRIAALLSLGAAGVARAEPVNLTFEQAVYVDGAKEGVPLRSPQGVACGAAGIMVADTGNERLVSYAFRDGRVSGGTQIKLSQLTYPVSLQLDGKGAVVALDGKTHRLVRVDMKGTFQGYLEIRNAGGGAVMPGAFKLDSADNLYVLDIAGRRVLAADANGVVKRQLELPKGLFTDVAADAAGTIYAVDAADAVVWSAEKTATAFKPLTKSLKDRMSFPTYMMTSRGKIFLVDQHGNGLVVLGIDGSYQGRQLSIGWGDGFVYYPSQICMTDEGQVLVADRDNNRVQYFNVVK